MSLERTLASVVLAGVAIVVAIASIRMDVRGMDRGELATYEGLALVLFVVSAAGAVILKSSPRPVVSYPCLAVFILGLTYSVLVWAVMLID